MLTTDQHYYLQQMDITVWQENNSKTTSQAEPNILEAEWDSLRQEALKCTKCHLCQTRTNVVFGVGNQQAELLIVGEAPGFNEDKKGEPFVGRAGQLLDAMLDAIELDRQQVYICNILKCRPPNNRDPAPDEVATCTPYLERQIQLVQPKLIVAVGRIAAHYLLGVKTPLGQLRGQRLQFGAQQIPLLVTYHPAYLLRNPKDKAKAWQDLLLAKAFIEAK
jgi:DNA polymerase